MHRNRMHASCELHLGATVRMAAVSGETELQCLCCVYLDLS